MKLIIAEKPQLAQVIAEAIGIVSRKDGYIECQNGYTVTNAIGHILSQKMPEEINSEYKEWKLEHLPLKVRPIPLKVKEQTSKQFNIVKGLLEKADTVINAGDPDDEGQLLVDEIIDFCNFKGSQQRILVNDLKTESARKALENIEPNSKYIGMRNKALARSQADYLFGLNLTRAYTLFARKKGFTGKLTIGRVQTPTLALIVRRYLANKEHKESYFYNVGGLFNFDNGSLNAKLVITDNIETDPNNEKEKRIIEKSVAEAIKTACDNAPCSIVSSTVEDKKTVAPLPFSLLDLQVRINNKYGYSSDEVLRITQDLREKHKAITYNRSDCRYLTEEQCQEAPNTLDFLVGLFGNLPTAQLDKHKKGRAFNPEKVSAHTAIIPVVENYKLSDFSEKEKHVFTEIVMQYIMQFLPEKTYQQITTIFQCGEYQFKATETKTLNEGWTKIVDDEEMDEDDLKAFNLLSTLKEKDTGICSRILIKQEKTKPLPLYTEATLLKDLANTAKYVKNPDIKKLLLDKDKGKDGENGGIGTPATRSAIIKHLNSVGYFEYQGKKLVPTQTGIDFIQSLPDILTYPDMTALWFEQQREIEQGALSVNAFLDHIEKFIAEQLHQAENVKIEAQGEPCECGKGVLRLIKGEKGSFFSCTAYPECKITKPALNNAPMPNCPCCKGNIKGNSAVIECVACGLKIWRKFFEKQLTDSQLLALLTKGKTSLIKGLKSKNGKEFEAYAKLNKGEKKIEPEFATKTTTTKEMRVVKVKREDLQFK
ncbi:type IA DNA topoisomerase [Pasteurella multocida]|uniref:type IA DNA topoisomerase n=1 Tax=Pasteurella multocida TaxID=747 RepID=UPI000CE8BF0C|nr:type IA DNA topoisomerase [Pasteurella multocida]PPE94926.1 type IA DNA topoisomerase [Pasteurella multocida]PPE95046.1 type IA DNA topoisomerase [Pasteurella multocida]HDR1501558.1 DNA topoisomerase III [Pasteurella multocida]